MFGQQRYSLLSNSDYNSPWLRTSIISKNPVIQCVGEMVGLSEKVLLMIINFVAINIFLFCKYKIFICNCIVLPLYPLLLAFTNTTGITRKRQWSLYWFIYILFILLEYSHQPVSDINLPFYWGFKCYFFVWCASPTATNGIDVLFFSYHVAWTIDGGEYFYESIARPSERGDVGVSELFSRKTAVTFRENYSSPSRSPSPRRKKKMKKKNSKSCCQPGQKCTCKKLPKKQTTKGPKLFKRLRSLGSPQTSLSQKTGSIPKGKKFAAGRTFRSKINQTPLISPTLSRAKAVKSKMYGRFKEKFGPFAISSIK
ncbi:hypothetical protein SNEBB_008748 [Seison nebaliae]|nr:hypothetical protein SNEBB_008748 [Seison nebaliae]